MCHSPRYVDTVIVEEQEGPWSNRLAGGSSDGLARCLEQSAIQRTFTACHAVVNLDRFLRMLEVLVIFGLYARHRWLWAVSD